MKNISLFKLQQKNQYGAITHLDELSIEKTFNIFDFLRARIVFLHNYLLGTGGGFPQCGGLLW